MDATSRTECHASCVAFALMTSALAASGARADGPCGAEWSARFAGAGITGIATELFVHDDGTEGGAQLYVAGLFSGAGGLVAPNIARYDGAQWSTVGAGLSSTVHGLGTFDFGQGERLTAVGGFTMGAGGKMAQWDGAQWVSVPPGLPSWVWLSSLGEFNGELYVSGPFVGGDSGYIRRWTGTEWGGAPPGTASVIWDQKVYDDGTGPALIMAGSPVVPGVPFTMGIAKWDGETWSALGLGINGLVYALAIFDDGDGPALYAGGMFQQLGGGQVGRRVARWRDGVWTQVGEGFDQEVRALAVFDDGSGPALYAGGKFSTSGDVTVNRLARWRGGPDAEWEPVGLGLEGGYVYGLGVFDDDGDGPIPPALYVAGDFQTAGGFASPGIARWGRCATCAGDIDGSGLVDGGDLAVILGQWGPSECAAPIPCPGDLDGSGAIDGSDLAIVLGAWGPCELQVMETIR